MPSLGAHLPESTPLEAGPEEQQLCCRKHFFYKEMSTEVNPGVSWDSSAHYFRRLAPPSSWPLSLCLESGQRQQLEVHPFSIPGDSRKGTWISCFPKGTSCKELSNICRMLLSRTFSGRFTYLQRTLFSYRSHFSLFCLGHLFPNPPFQFMVFQTNDKMKLAH